MISGFCGYGNLLPNMAKRHFADVFELRVLSWEIILDYAGELKIQSQITLPREKVEGDDTVGTEEGI